MATNCSDSEEAQPWRKEETRGDVAEPGSARSHRGGTSGGRREGCTCIITFQSPGDWPRDAQEPPSRRALHPELPEVREARLEARGPSSLSSFA